MAIVGAGFTGPLDGALPASARSRPAGHAGRGRGRGLRGQRPQRRLVLGAAAHGALVHGGSAPGGTPPSPCSGRCSPPSTRSGRAAAEEGIDCHYAKGGYLHLATNPAHTVRLRDELEEARRFGLGEDDLRWLDRAEAAERLGAAGRPRCALHAALRGHPPGPAGPGAGRPPWSGTAPSIYEATRATAIEPGRVAHRPRHAHGPTIVVRATEGYTPTSTASAGRWCRSTRS